MNSSRFTSKSLDGKKDRRGTRKREAPLGVGEGSKNPTDDLILMWSSCETLNGRVDSGMYRFKSRNVQQCAALIACQNQEHLLCEESLQMGLEALEIFKEAG